MPQQRYKITIAYRGTNYHGWQMQPPNEMWKGEVPPEGAGIPTIQETVMRALQSVVNHPITLVGSSRTDGGVHAKGQIAHFDTDQLQIPMKGLREATNARLPMDVLVRSIEPVPDTFDAITSTVSKRYQYWIWNSTHRPVFFSDLVWHRWLTLHPELMREAAKMLEGEHDFASFARPGHGRDHTIRTIYNCDVSWRLPKIVIGVEGSGFLWNMVRIIVGTLVEIGLRKYEPERIKDILEAKNREEAGPTAPSHGLYLQWIKLREEPKSEG